MDQDFRPYCTAFVMKITFSAYLSGHPERGSIHGIDSYMIIDTLESLQNETRKTIGVISHTEAMVKRITAQISLNRNGQVYSSVEIVG